MNKTIIVGLALISALLLGSCKTKRDLALFEDLQGVDSGVLATLPHNTAIEPENELIITVNSEVPEAAAPFNLPYSNTVLAGTKEVKEQQSVQTYEVDPKGDIDFPILGRIHVAGMTTYELKDYLIDRISAYVKKPMVTVVLNGYRVSVIGEVDEPQTITTRVDRFSVLDALAECGDMTEFARRDNVMVMRRTADGQIEYGRLNLLNSNITRSPYFWLQNNDIVIVEPNKIKQDNSKYNQNNSFKLSVVSTIVSSVSVIASLVIALTR